MLRRSPDQTLKALADMGFKDAEGYNRPATLALAPKLKQFGIAPRSCQVEVPLITQFWDPHPDLKPIPLNEAVDGVAAAGVEFFTLSAIGNGERGDGDDFYRRTADRMNAAGELCRKAKIRFAWQLSALDFEGHPGARAIDIYKERVDPKLAPMELDIPQALAAHQNVEAILKAWKGHVPLIRTTAPLFAQAPGAEYVFLGLDVESDDPLAALKALQSSTGSR
jgi:sugar phosphate isomerase/epimerase